MRITDDIIKALQNCIDAIGSISEFSQRSNINIETLSKYMNKKKQSIRKETWQKLYPLIHTYLPKTTEPEAVVQMQQTSSHDDKEKYANPTSDEKILLDAFAALPNKLKNQKLLEVVELARQQVASTKASD